MELSDWNKLFPPRILSRGQEYYDQGRVEQLRQQGGSVQATVRGSEPYQVELELERGLIASWYCTCPYGADGAPCKHLAAVFRALEAAEDRPPLAELVARLTASEAKALLLELADEHPPAAAALRRRLAPPPRSR